ncbi:MAG TPA: hypothetical protein VFQ90_12260 [Stellaceae bacterium]|jgi:hypothetical protein|nr:hypothetical protein [Stellaceae bacterium]
MMFIIRSDAGTPTLAGVQVKVSRKTPEIVPTGAGKTDYFCVGETQAMAALRAEGWDVVELRDGWYADDAGGGVGISGHGRYWEVRDTPLTVKEAVGPADAPAATEGGEEVNVRKAIFGV